MEGWTDENVKLLRELDAACRSRQMYYILTTGDCESDVEVCGNVPSENFQSRSWETLQLALEQALEFVNSLP